MKIKKQRKPASDATESYIHMFFGKGKKLPPDNPNTEIFVTRFKYQQYTEIEAMSAQDALHLHKTNHHLIYWFYPPEGHKTAMKAAQAEYGQTL